MLGSPPETTRRPWLAALAAVAGRCDGCGGPLGCPDGICVLYWRTLSTVINRIGIRPGDREVSVRCGTRF